MFSSIPVWAHIVALSIYVSGIVLPDKFYESTTIIGNAQPLIGMLLLGCSLEFPRRPGIWWQIGRLLAIHYGTVTVLAVLCYFLLPYSRIVRAIMVTILFSPLALGGLVATDEYGLDQDMAGLLNSITILIGIAAVTILIPLLGISG